MLWSRRRTISGPCSGHMRAVFCCCSRVKSCFNFSWVTRTEASVLPWEVSVSAWPARVWVVFWLSVMKSSSFFSSLVIKFSILPCWADMEFLRVGGCAFAASILKCVMLEGTEGDPIEVGVIGRSLMRFGSWLGFGDIGMFAEGLGSMIGFMNLGAKS